MIDDRRMWMAALVAWALGSGGATRAAEPESGKPTLKMSPAIACKSIDGYEDYEVLPGAALTRDEKLLIYYRPLEFKTERKEREYKAHLIQDGRIRRQGRKGVLASKDKMIDYEPKSERPFNTLYVKCVVSLKDLKPGDYEFEIILHDEIAAGPPATQILSFRVVAAGEPKPSQAPGAP